jgi:hypothetical protein
MVIVNIYHKSTTLTTYSLMYGRILRMNSDRLPSIDDDRIAFQQILVEDQSVYSIQTVVIPGSKAADLTTERLLQLYIDYIQRFTFGLLRVTKSVAGVEFRLNGSDIAIINFAPPTLERDGDREKTTLRICGGFLVQPQECDKGQLDFIIEPVDYGRRVTLRLADFCPLILGSRQPSIWRKWLYRFTQAYLHKVVTIRFLAMVYRKITGEHVANGAVRIEVRKGSNI